MNLSVSGIHMNVGDSLRDHCADSIKALQSYLPEIVDVNVAFSKQRHIDKAEISIHASHIHLRAHAEGDDFFQAVDQGVDKLRRQLEKYKGRINKERQRQPKEELQEQFAAVHRISEESLENEATGYAPDVTHKEVKSLEVHSVDEAVMQMDLLHTTAYVFIHDKTGKLSVVNREEDGAIRWVEIDRAASANN